MIEVLYFLDNNALSKLSEAERASSVVLECCRIPSEIMWEARGYLREGELKALEYPMTVEVLEALREVMATVPAGDTKLVDLYHNRGNADPLLVACALAANREEAQYLLAPEWKIVSDDQAVRSKATEFDVAVLTTPEFQRIIVSDIV